MVWGAFRGVGLASEIICVDKNYLGWYCVHLIKTTSVLCLADYHSDVLQFASVCKLIESLELRSAYYWINNLNCGIIQKR